MVGPFAGRRTIGWRHSDRGRAPRRDARLDLVVVDRGRFARLPSRVGGGPMACERKLVRPEGLEPPAYWFEASRSIQLSYGRLSGRPL